MNSPKIKIDLYSDTKTKPSPAMREAMAAANVGDDMVGEDPTTNRLEAMAAELFGKEAAVFACSGTQSNQMGVRAHCLPGDELLIEESGHIANFEAGAPAVLSGVTCRTITGKWGMLDVSDLDGKIRGSNVHLCRTRLVCLENTTNSGGGKAYPLEQLKRVSEWARSNGLKMHLDGARFFNAITAGGYSPREVAELFDTISICFSKGLGCPMGSVLVGSSEEIAHARRSRKLFGGALRQAGVVAAAAVYALENNIERLAQDHANAKLFAEQIAEIPGIVISLEDVESNLVFFEVDPEVTNAAQLAAATEERGVRLSVFGPIRLRACTHLDISRDDVLEAATVLKECMSANLKEGAESSSAYARG